LRERDVAPRGGLSRLLGQLLERESDFLARRRERGAEGRVDALQLGGEVVEAREEPGLQRVEPGERGARDRPPPP
jgi:hypothetical protein